ncbi:hypothetical protein AQUCO_01100234v1 [Aquilegia coerulea]|uniref:V-type proton ATPase subunit G n=1 Tax=Aquilegia coerulea TaxID=218851 RepID=A0A2G5E660_AQUCA|nr:hypothetical protein AQUCO_01100234v1 [Aquilegia coerulea]
MEALKGQGGVQMLLTAEQEAQQIVANARNLKMTRLKQAKDEADGETSRYRTQMEAEYRRKISESTDNSGSTVRRLEEETVQKIKSLKDAGSKISSDVVGMLLKVVMSAKT